MVNFGLGINIGEPKGTGLRGGNKPGIRDDTDPLMALLSRDSSLEE